MFAGFRGHRDDHQKIRGCLVDPHALAPNLLGQALFHAAQTVLNLHLRIVDIGARLERQINGRRAIGTTGCLHIQETFDAIELLLYDLGDIGFQHRSVCARISHADAERGRCNRRILLDSQVVQCEQTAEANDQRNDPGKDRALDEEMRSHGALAPSAPWS